jgi:hypothetical protein
VALQVEPRSRRKHQKTVGEEQFGQNDIARAYDAVANGSKGKVVLEL